MPSDKSIQDAAIRNFVTQFSLPEEKEDEESDADCLKDHENPKETTVADPVMKWQQDGEGDFRGIPYKIHGILPAGSYDHIISDGKVYYRPIRSLSDTLIDLPGLPIRYVLDQIKNFWSKTENYHKYGFMQKRGIMFYGPPGVGKTCIISMLKDQLVREMDGVIFPNSSGFGTLISGISDFRKREPERPIMTICEDLETQLEGSDGAQTGASEKMALSLYDGEHQFDRIVHIATTNKPELLAERFIKRPGRFDLVIEVHAPTREAREVYLRTICKNALSESQTVEILDATEGLSLAFMREIAMTYLVLEIPLEETIERIAKHSKAKFSSKKTKTGFTVGFHEPDKD